MSSAILLAAIVAIWACALVPRWVRRTHEVAPGQDQETVEPEEAYLSDSLRANDDGEATGLAYDTDRGYTSERAYEDDQYETEHAYETEQAYDTERAYDRERGYDPELPTRAHYREGDEYPSRGLAAATSAGTPGRARVLQARRRTLTVLALLVIASVGSRVLGLAHSWIVIPPAAMLGTYLLVLRVAVYADAENAARRAAAHAHAEAHARAVARSHAVAAARSRAAAAREAAQAQAPEPTAEVIDIAAHARPDDQLYDQYEDATVRAIGD